MQWSFTGWMAIFFMSMGRHAALNWVKKAITAAGTVFSEILNMNKNN
jgi:hypothetical protein